MTAAILAARRCLQRARMHRALTHWGNPDEVEIWSSELMAYDYAKAGLAILANVEKREAGK